ncbi:hypothetical protein [Planomonospora sp. ID82291]|uniref:hypothetical protein n=1 Tax=Planomonospora sp. ID82291 TaxID=2738136 RepID=UPI0018C428B1|nr:hypothetical protein [Planomonospora sp. ID82291]
MPRRRPGALRVHPWADRRRYRPASRIPGLSSRTSAAIARIELQNRYLEPGSVTAAFVEYRRFLRRPGRYLYLPEPDCPCCDPAEARDTLEYALRRLRHSAGAELSRLVTRLDEEFYRRTLPDPRPCRWPGAFNGWWYHRLYER